MQPLEGIRVIDISRFLPGPSCTWFLADMGADVLRIEEFGPPTGRRAEQAAGVGERRRSEKEVERRALHGTYQRNKRSMGLNLKTEEGRGILHDLVKTADVFVEAFRPGVARRLGADYDTLSNINPRIIYCSITPYGQTGPYINLGAFDPCAGALSGAIAVNGDLDGRPTLYGIPVADVSSGLHGAYGIMCALWARQTTSRGQHVDIAMSDTMMSFMGTHAARYLSTGNATQRGFPSLTVMPPLETKDGKYIVSVNEVANFWANWCRALGRPDLIPLWHEPDRKRRAELLEEVREIVKTKTRDEWFQIAQDEDIAMAPVLEVDEVFQDPHVLARGMIVEMEHPGHGRIKHIGLPIKLSDTSGAIRSLPAPLGQHTEEVMAELGHAPEEIQRLREHGVIQ